MEDYNKGRLAMNQTTLSPYVAFSRHSYVDWRPGADLQIHLAGAARVRRKYFWNRDQLAPAVHGGRLAHVHLSPDNRCAMTITHMDREAARWNQADLF